MTDVIWGRFCLYRELGISVNPLLGSLQSTVYYDTVSNRFFRVDILHQRSTDFAFQSSVSLSDQYGNRETKDSILTKDEHTREEMLSLVAELYPRKS